MKGAVYNALYNFAANQSLRTPYFSCPSGNCTWNSFPALGVCSQCLNITDSIQVGKCDYGSTGNGSCLAFVPNSNGTPIAFLDVWWPGAMNVTCLNNTVPIGSTPPTAPIIEFIMMNSSNLISYTSQEVKNTLSAFHCKLNWCIQNVMSTVSNGVYAQSFSPILPQVFTRLSNMTVTDDVLWELSVRDIQPFIISGIASGALTSFLQIFNGNLEYDVEAGNSGWSSDAIEALWGSSDVSGLMESVAISMSTRFSAAPSYYDNYYDGFLKSVETVVGTNFVMEPHFAVSWKWMSLPVAVLLLTWIFLLSIMRKTKQYGVGIWKTSTYPLLFHGLCDQAKLEASNCETVNAMQKKAKSIAVQLVNHEGDGPSLLSHDAELSETLITRKRFSSMSGLSKGKRSYANLHTGSMKNV